MPERNEEIGDLVRRGAVLFSGLMPFPVPHLIGALGAAVLTGILNLRDQSTEEILNRELGLSHISYVEPGNRQLLQFYAENPMYPGLASEFSPELESGQIGQLRAWYPYLYGALVLRRQVPHLLYHREIDDRKFRIVAQGYEHLSRGFHAIQSRPDLRLQVSRFSLDLRPLLEAAYEAAKSEIKSKENRFVFDWIDWIRDISSI